MSFGHEALLEMETDGRVDPTAREHARRADAAMRPSVARETAALMEGAARKQRRDVVGEMARAICTAVAARQSVQVQDFRRIGIDDAEAREMFPIALKRARRLDRAVDAAMECVA